MVSPDDCTGENSVPCASSTVQGAFVDYALQWVFQELGTQDPFLRTLDTKASLVCDLDRRKKIRMGDNCLKWLYEKNWELP